MWLEEKLFGENQQFLFNELERERFKNDILRLYESAINSNDRAIIQGAFAALDIVSFVSVEDFLRLFIIGVYKIPDDNSYMSRFSRSDTIISKILHSSAVVNPEPFLHDYFEQSNKDYALFTRESISDDLGQIDPNNKQKLEQLIMQINKQKISDEVINNSVFYELFNLPDILFLKDYEQVFNSFLESNYEQSKHFSNPYPINERSKVFFPIPRVLQRIIDLSPDSFIVYFNEQLKNKSNYFESYDERKGGIKRNSFTSFIEILAQSLSYLLVSTITKSTFSVSEHPLSLFFKSFVQQVPFSKEEIPEIIESVKINIIQNESMNYKKLNGIMSFNEIKSLKELLECYSIQSNYQLISILGQGASGTTYKVYSPELKKQFALKVINDKFNPQEAELMAKLRGEDLENIVQVHDAGKHIVKVVDEEKYAILMEYVEGNHLIDMMKALKGSLSVLQVGAQLLNGIESLRNYNITHRDLNPKNIKVDQYGHVKILDFGIATDEENPEQVDARRYGSPRGKNADDLFSLGLLLFEMYEGYHLVSSKSENEGSTTHANRVTEYKQRLLDEHGEVSHDYFYLVRNKFGFLVQSCLEADDVLKIETEFIRFNPDIKYYFMRRAELIDELIHHKAWLDEARREIDELKKRFDLDDYIRDGLIVRIRELEKELVQYHGVKGNDEVKIDGA